MQVLPASHVTIGCNIMGFLFNITLNYILSIIDRKFNIFSMYNKIKTKLHNLSTASEQLVNDPIDGDFLKHKSVCYTCRFNECLLR